MSSRIMALAMALMVGGCSGSGEVEVVKCFPLNSLEGVLTRSNVALDREVSSDGAGSLRITANCKTTVRLFEVTGVDVEEARLVYRAKLRSQDVQGIAYLEMWVHFPAKGEFFSRGLARPLTGTTEWVTEEVPFYLKEGEKPDLIRLNLVIDGSGTVWVDDVSLLRAPLGE